LELFEEYRAYYKQLSPFRKHVVQMKTGERFNRAEYISDEDFLKTEFYQEYFSKQDAFNFEYRVLFKEGETVAGVSFSRPRRMDNFSKREQHLMNVITPHVQSALQLHLKFAEVRRENEILSECFEKAVQGLVIVNRLGKVVFVNESAKRLISVKDGLQTNQNGILSACLAAESKKMKILLRSVFEPNIRQKVNFGGIMQVSRKSGRRPLSVFIAPFSGNELGVLPTQRMAVLFINDPELKLEGIETILSRIYQLTPAESKIAAILAEGKSLDEACGLLGIKRNTIRTHLKRIFSKTETKRQTELVRLILGNLNNVNFFS
jgi:DNA-binding CsgD family transcriptional regulator